MTKPSSDDFETMWEQSIRLPAHKEISVEKIKLELSITDLMDQYLDYLKEAVAQRKMKKDVYEQLVTQTTGYKDALSKVHRGLLERLEGSHIRRRLGLGSRGD